MSNVKFEAQKFAARRLLALALMACRVARVFLPDEEAKKRLKILASEFAGKYKGAIKKSNSFEELKDNVNEVAEEMELRMEQIDNEYEQRNQSGSQDKDQEQG